MRKNTNDSGVSPVIAVILMVAITVVLAGVLYLWVSSLADTDEGAETLNVKAEAYADSNVADVDKVVIEVIGGTITWGDYKVTVAGEQWYTATASGSAGDSVTFYDEGAGAPADAEPGFDVGNELTIKIVNLGDNKVVWEKDLTAKSYASA